MSAPHIVLSIVSVWPGLVVVQWGSVPACSAALADYIWLLGWGLDPSVCVWQMAQCQYANVTTFIQRCVCVSVYESKRGTEREIYTHTHTHSCWTVMKTLCAFCDMWATVESSNASFPSVTRLVWECLPNRPLFRFGADVCAEAVQNFFFFRGWAFGTSLCGSW